jgi:uncharacterized protein
MTLVLLGLMAGLTTTLAGMGGGTLLVLALALVHDPVTALAVSTPALMLGNLHRVALYRKQIVWTEAKWLVAGGLPAALVGGLLVAGLPDAFISGLMLLVALLATGKHLGLPLKPPAGATLPVAALTGVVSATSGGGGVIAGPYLLARGLQGVPYVATGALGAASIHLGKITAYGATGLATTDTLVRGLALAALIAAGNLLGERMRRFIGDTRQQRLQLGVMVACVGMALAGL